MDWAPSLQQKTIAKHDSKSSLQISFCFMDRQIAQIEAVCDYVQGRMRSPKKLWLSFDEWNVWYRQRGGDGEKKVAPHLLEEIYDLEDALLVGGLVNSLIRNSDRVRVACLAQLVNVIAPIMSCCRTLRQSWRGNLHRRPLDFIRRTRLRHAVQVFRNLQFRGQAKFQIRPTRQVNFRFRKNGKGCAKYHQCQVAVGIPRRQVF